MADQEKKLSTTPREAPVQENLRYWYDGEIIFANLSKRTERKLFSYWGAFLLVADSVEDIHQGRFKGYPAHALQSTRAFKRVQDGSE